MYFYVVVAAVGALIFAVSAVRQPRLGLVAAALVWTLYTVYEYFIANGTLCDANCNIRVDLLLIWPLLLFVSLAGIYPPGSWSRTGKILGGAALALSAFIVAALLYMMFVETPAAQRAAEGQSQPSAPAAASQSTAP